MKNYNCVLSIAGSDCSGGAGIQADIKTIAATGCYAASVITALTAQNTQGVQHISEISPEFIRHQLCSIFSDINIAAVKIGMLHREEVIDEVANSLLQWCPASVVLDPVMVAKNGTWLITESAIKYLKQYLFPLVSLITPNIKETEVLLAAAVGNNGSDTDDVNKTNDAMVIRTVNDMQHAAIHLGKEFGTNVLVKGGHRFEHNTTKVIARNSSIGSGVSHGELSDMSCNENEFESYCVDILYLYEQDRSYWFKAKRVNTINTHGTGCTLSSAIASYLAQNYDLIDAIRKAKQYLTSAIVAGSVYKLGNGCGPIHHFFMYDTPDLDTSDSAI